MVHSMSDKLRTWLNDELLDRGWSARELGRRSGYTGAYISRILAGEQKGTFDFCAAIAPHLDKTPGELFRLVGLLPSEPEQGISEDKLLQMYRQLQPLQQQFLIEASKGLRGVVARQDAAPLPEIPEAPDPEDLMDLFVRLDQVRKREVYNFTRWVLAQQEYPLNSSYKLSEAKKKEWLQAVEHIDLLLAVEEADPQVIARVIDRLQGMLGK